MFGEVECFGEVNEEGAERQNGWIMIGGWGRLMSC